MVEEKVRMENDSFDCLPFSRKNLMKEIENVFFDETTCCLIVYRLSVVLFYFIF